MVVLLAETHFEAGAGSHFLGNETNDAFLSLFFQKVQKTGRQDGACWLPIGDRCPGEASRCAGLPFQCGLVSAVTIYQPGNGSSQPGGGRTASSRRHDQWPERAELRKKDLTKRSYSWRRPCTIHWIATCREKAHRTLQERAERGPGRFCNMFYFNILRDFPAKNRFV